MSRLNTVTLENAGSPAKEMLTAVKEKYGMVPNFLRGVANSAPALQSVLGLIAPLENFSLDAQEREVVALTANQFNGCDYCLAGHTALAKMAGFSEEETVNIRRGKPSKVKHKALVDFTRAMLEAKGNISAEHLYMFLDAGYNDGSVAEVVALIAYKTFSNYFNNANLTDLDFPPAPSIS